MNAEAPLNTTRTVVITINAAWNIVNFRMGLIRALQAAGYRVVALAPDDRHSARLVEHDIEFVPIVMDKQGISPARDLLLLGRYVQALKHIRPDILLAYTAKPNIYGSLAAQLLGIPTINNVAGLGTAFIRKGPLTKIVTMLYRLAFQRSQTVFFQNCEDRDLFVSTGIVKQAQAGLLPGSGVDLSAFAPVVAERSGEEFRFLMVGRLLRDKGVYEYVEAARLVRASAGRTKFQLLGFLDAENRTAISRAEVEAWVAEGVIEYLGEAEDVRPAVGAAHCIVLPSYREGLPRALLEGAAMAKPLIATDVPGCRHVVEHGRNGYLCAVQDSRALAEAMLKMVRLTDDERLALGKAGRAMVEAEFDEREVFRSYVSAIVAATDLVRAVPKALCSD